MLKRLLLFPVFTLAFCLCMEIRGHRGNLMAAQAFRSHGVAAPVARGNPKTIEGEDGSPVIFMSIGGTFLFIDAMTGEWEQVDPELRGGGGLASYLSRNNRFYQTLGGYLVELDLKKRSFKRAGEVPEGSARSITECKDGKIYIGMWPNAELIIYNPSTGELENHGPMGEEEWRQYPYVAVDDKGWVYVGITMRRINLIGYNPATGERRQLLAEDERVTQNVPSAIIYRGRDGRVYTRPGRKGQWLRLYGGEAEKAGFGVSSQEYRAPSRFFPDGSELLEIDVPNRYYVIRESGKEATRRLTFDYRIHAGGPRIYCMTAGPDGAIYGGTGVLRLFRYCPETDTMVDREFGGRRGHINAITEMGGKIYAAVYASGLNSYDPSRPFNDADTLKNSSPRHLYGGRDDREATDTFGRPFAILAHPDGRHIVMGGNPYRAHTGGGMLIYDTLTGDASVHGHEKLLYKQGVNAIAAVGSGDLVIGGTIAAATGGVREAEEAQLCVFDWEKKEVVFRKVPVPGAGSIRGLVPGGDGIVYGIAGREHFFVFDVNTGWVLHREDLSAYGRLTGLYQVMKMCPSGKLYILFREAIVQMDPETFEHRIAGTPPEAATAGLTISGGRLYFASDSGLWSFGLDAK